MACAICCGQDSLDLYLMGYSYHINKESLHYVDGYNSYNIGVGVGYSKDLTERLGIGSIATVYRDSYRDTASGITVGPYLRPWIKGDWSSRVLVGGGYLNGSGYAGPIAASVGQVSYRGFSINSILYTFGSRHKRHGAWKSDALPLNVFIGYSIPL